MEESIVFVLVRLLLVTLTLITIIFLYLSKLFGVS